MLPCLTRRTGLIEYSYHIHLPQILNELCSPTISNLFCFVNNNSVKAATAVPAHLVSEACPDMYRGGELRIRDDLNKINPSIKERFLACKTIESVLQHLQWLHS